MSRVDILTAKEHDDAVVGDESSETKIVAAYARRSAAIPAGRYSYFHPANLQCVQQREREALKLLAIHGFQSLCDFHILEVGCGTAMWLREFIKWGALPENLTGLDLLPNRIEAAKSLTPPGVRLKCGSAAQLNFPAEKFDIVLQSTVFTSILDDGLKEQVAREMIRVVKPNGLILWYDFCFNNPSNPDVRGVKRSEIHRLFPGCQIDLKRITLAPPLSRRLVHLSGSLCEVLQRCPFLCTHYLGAIRPA